MIQKNASFVGLHFSGCSTQRYVKSCDLGPRARENLLSKKKCHFFLRCAQTLDDACLERFPPPSQVLPSLLKQILKPFFVFDLS